METDLVESCSICLGDIAHNEKIKLKCSHLFCKTCLKTYINVLKAYRQLTPQKLKCLQQDCQEQIQDDVLLAIFPGEQGFVLKTIKKCYKESKNPSSVIFSCVGIMRQNHKQLIDKPAHMTRDQHTKVTNQLVKQIQNGEVVLQGIKTCNNIHIYNKSVLSKDKLLQCFLCGVSYCLACFEISHVGSCAVKKQDPMLNLKKGKNTDNFQEYIAVNQIRRCLNPKCTVPIDKQQGCFWVKCRCSWQMCYPCNQLWGNCEHFSKYPYQKFVPPADWLVKALNLY